MLSVKRKKSRGPLTKRRKVSTTRYSRSRSHIKHTKKYSLIKTVLFDLDGTIFNTNELIIQSFLHALKDVVPSNFTREDIIPQMGLPLKKQLQLFSKREDVSDLVKRYRQYSLKKHDELITIFPHVDEVMRSLAQKGIQIGIVTTKVRETTERAINFFGLHDVVDVVISYDDVKRVKPHPEPIRQAMRKLGAKPGTTMMVGDSPVDIQAAHAASVMAVGVSWSLKGKESLVNYYPHVIIDDMRDLYRFIHENKEITP